MTTRPRLSKDPSSQLFSIQSFAGVSRFLREAVADEESRQMRDSMDALVAQIDGALSARRQRNTVQALTQRVGVLSDALRQHQTFVTGLGPDWRAMYEYGAYLESLRRLLSAAMQWRDALVRRGADETVRFKAFDTMAWKTLGEGLLLIDMYEHCARQGEEAAYPAEARPRFSPLARLRVWLRRNR